MTNEQILRDALTKIAEYPRDRNYELTANACRKIARDALALSATGAAEAPVAWLHEIIEPDGQSGKLYSTSTDNPWSHWLESYKGDCKYTVTPLYTAPPSPTPAAEDVTGAAGTPIPVWELTTGGWDTLDEIEPEWLESLPFGTKLYYLPPAPALPVVAEPARRHPLEIYAESYDQMGRDGDGMVHCSNVAADIRQNMITATSAITPSGQLALLEAEFVKRQTALRERKAAFGAECMELGAYMAKEGGK